MFSFSILRAIDQLRYRLRAAIAALMLGGMMNTLATATSAD